MGVAEHLVYIVQDFGREHGNLVDDEYLAIQYPGARIILGEDELDVIGLDFLLDADTRPRVDGHAVYVSRCDPGRCRDCRIRSARGKPPYELIDGVRLARAGFPGEEHVLAGLQDF